MWPSLRPAGCSWHGRGKIRQASLALGTEQGRREAGCAEATAWLGLLATRGADPGHVTASVSHSTLQVHCYVWVTVNIRSQTGLPGSASPSPAWSLYAAPAPGCVSALTSCSSAPQRPLPDSFQAFAAVLCLGLCCLVAGIICPRHLFTWPPSLSPWGADPCPLPCGRWRSTRVVYLSKRGQGE